jgi:putative hemolysin
MGRADCQSGAGSFWLKGKRAVQQGDKHIIDTLIEERAPGLAASPLWPLLRPPLYRLLNYRKAVMMANAIASLSGRDALSFISALLSVKLTMTGLHNIPKAGRCVIIANHPTGIADGIAAWDGLKAIRPDMKFYANADAHRVCARFDDVLIPVEWELHKRTREKTRETLRLTQLAMDEERALFIFPAGRLARVKDGILTEPDWMNSAVAIARKNNAPIIPIHMKGPWSFWFHFLGRFSSELRDITLFKELLNKKDQNFSLQIGRPIAPDALAGDSNALTKALQTFVTQDLAIDGDARFQV